VFAPLTYTVFLNGMQVQTHNSASPYCVHVVIVKFHLILAVAFLLSKVYTLRAKFFYYYYFEVFFDRFKRIATKTGRILSACIVP